MRIGDYYYCRHLYLVAALLLLVLLLLPTWSKCEQKHYGEIAPGLESGAPRPPSKRTNNTNGTARVADHYEDSKPMRLLQMRTRRRRTVAVPLFYCFFFFDIYFCCGICPLRLSS
jgi:hypothetical protein